MFVVASTIISKREEFFLDCVLESVKEAVDLIIINDNSDDKENPNLKIIKNSNLYKQDKVKILFNKFNGFDEARNQILDFIKSLNFKDLWILKLDCDEAHTHELKKITRNILPKLPFYVGGIDCYYYHFIQSFDYYYSIDRRHNFLVRFNSELFWEGRVHEKLKNVQGKILVTPYLFFHYGAVIPRSEVLEKWKLYAYLGDKTFGNLDDSSYILNYEARFCLKFNKVHPQIMQGKIK
ncbi:MAG: hypothetical protein HYU63_01500, partial [Armatimonadetes bacterium]|nr:hypothetical protein [Armatimonadota bacterium]